MAKDPCSQDCYQRSCVGLVYSVGVLISSKYICTVLVIAHLLHAGEELRNWRVFPIELDSIAMVPFGGADRAGRASASAAATSVCGGPRCSRRLAPSQRGLARVCASLPGLWSWMKAGIDGLARRMQLTSPSPSPTLAIHRNNSCGLADMAGTWWRQPLRYIRLQRNPAGGVGGANCSARTASRAVEGPVFHRHAPQFVAPRMLQRPRQRRAVTLCLYAASVRAGWCAFKPQRLLTCLLVCRLTLHSNNLHACKGFDQVASSHVPVNRARCMLQRVWVPGYPNPTLPYPGG